MYNIDSHITTVKDVENFFKYIILDRKVNFHPDDSFDDYINISTRKNTFTDDEIKIFNRLLDESFEVCEQNNVDIYGIGLEYLMSTFEN